jgi:omega-amidase
MRTHLLQLDIAWHDKQANFDKVERLLSRADPDEGDLVILPEMFDTGFSMDTAVTADMAGETLKYLMQLAGDLGIYLQGGRTVRACTKVDCKAQNRAPIIGPDGALLLEYAKVHPFTYGKEPDHFEGGREVMTYRWGADAGLTVCPAICYDLRFPELFRIGLAKGAEAFAIGANWPQPRQHHWRALLIARAIENQAFVFAVNRTGNDPNLAYAGGSIAISPRGEVLRELGPEEATLSIEVDPAEVHRWREKFPAWKDARLLKGVGVDPR